MIVRHMCGHTECVNPDHLAIGSHLDNANDRDRDGNTMRHDKHWNAKLTCDDVLRIRRMSEVMGKDLAKMFGVAQSTISAIRKSKIWRGVSDAAFA